MSRVLSLLSELRDRRIFQIFVSYLAGGWLLLQVVSQLVAHGIAPNVAYIVTLIWYIGGLPGVLLIGWYHGEKGEQKAPRLEVFSLSILGMLCVAVSSVAISNHLSGKLAAAAAENGLNLRRVGVLYFRDLTRGAEMQYLADGLTEDLIAELGRVQALDVVSKNGMAQFRDTDLPVDSIGRLLQTGTLVDGSVERIGDRVRINLRLVDGASGAEFRRTAFEHPADQILEMRERLADETSRILREWVGAEIRLHQLAGGTSKPGAWALYQRAEKIRKDAESHLLHHGSVEDVSRLFRSADSLLAQAEVVDTAWLEPVVLRGFLAYRQSRLAHAGHEIPLAVAWIDRGVEHAERALRRSPSLARALELRGTLHYFHWLLRVTPDPQRQAELLRTARADLERAVEIDPSLASAHSTLSHMYYTEDVPSAVLAARKAYEEDAYLDVANEVLWRLTSGSYDLAQFTQAQRWCDEGARRFPTDWRFTNCQLLLLTSPVGQGGVDRAWQLLAQQEPLVPEVRRAYERARGHLLVGGAIARAGLADSASAVLDRGHAMITHEIDPIMELYTVEAYMRTLLGRNDQAVELLKRYAAVNPGYSFDHHWWWQGVRSEPAFREIRGDH